MSPTLLQDNRRAQTARNHENAPVMGDLPCAHGTISTVGPHVGQFTRRMAYTRYTGKPHSGTKRNRRVGW